jgi:hypothetical protein
MAAACDKRSSRTTGFRPYFVLKALISASAFSGSSYCTGRAAYSGHTKVMEQPPKRHGSVHPAATGAAGTSSAATMMLRLSILHSLL